MSKTERWYIKNPDYKKVQTALKCIAFLTLFVTIALVLIGCNTNEQKSKTIFTQEQSLSGKLKIWTPTKSREQSWTKTESLTAYLTSHEGRQFTTYENDVVNTSTEKTIESEELLLQKQKK